MGNNLKECSGGCLCGKVRYHIKQEPMLVGRCHCRSCQQATGGAYYPFIAVATESINVCGDYSEHERIGASGHKVYAGFCKSCGSTLFGRPEVWPHLRTVSIMSLDDPSLFEPQVDVWMEDAWPWALSREGVASFPKNPKK